MPWCFLHRCRWGSPNRWLSSRAGRFRFPLPPMAKRPISTAVPLGSDSLLVAVVLPGADESKPALRLGNRPVVSRLVGYDPVSRLGFLRVEARLAKAPEWLEEGAGASSGANLQRDGPRRCACQCRTTGWVKQVGGKILPLALLRVNFDRPVPPARHALWSIPQGVWRRWFSKRRAPATPATRFQRKPSTGCGAMFVQAAALSAVGSAFRCGRKIHRHRSCASFQTPLPPPRGSNPRMSFERGHAPNHGLRRCGKRVFLSDSRSARAGEIAARCGSTRL